jgi:hypothetical protein
MTTAIVQKPSKVAIGGKQYGRIGEWENGRMKE